MIPKKAQDLINRPFFTAGGNRPEPPVATGLKILTTERGKRLEMVSRVRGEEMVRALQIGTIYTQVYGSKYVAERVDQIKRVSKSINGEGIRELIDMVEAGGKMPGEFFTGPDNKKWRILEEDGDA